MSDQWRAKVATLAGQPVAVVEVSFTRTLLIDPEVYERIANLLRDGEGESSGLKSIDEFYRMVQQLPPESRRFIVVPWTDADGQRVGLRSFAEIVRLFDERAYWRVEGTAATGFTGYFNIGGQDRKVDLSESAIPRFREKLDATRRDAVAANAAGELSDEERRVIETICDMAGRGSYACESAYRAYAEVLKQRERQARERQERELKEMEQDNSEVRYEGDFPAGYERAFSGYS